MLFGVERKSDQRSKNLPFSLVKKNLNIRSTKCIRVNEKGSKDDIYLLILIESPFEFTMNES